MEFAIVHIFGHGENEQGLPIYLVGWYGYSLKDDIREPARNIPDNFLRRYHAWR